MKGLLIAAFLLAATSGDDWPMFGRDATRNPASPEKNPATEWSLDEGRERHLAWKGRLGSWSQVSPIVANGIVWAGTNATDQKDGGVLLAFREKDGLLLGSHFAPRRKAEMLDSRVYSVDPGRSPVRCTPVVEGDRLWYVNTRWEVSCLDIRALREGPGEVREVWKFELIEKLGVTPITFCGGQGPHCAIGGPYRGRVYISTGHSIFGKDGTIARREAPTLICLDQGTGELLGRDPGGIIEGTVLANWSAPLVVEADGKGILLFGGGDGFLYAFDPIPDPATRQFLRLWKVDCNPPGTDQKARQGIAATPTVVRGRIFVVLGTEPLGVGTPGALSCIEVSTGKILWQDAKIGASMSTPVIDQGVVYVVEYSGFVHALDAANGRRLWTHDFLELASGVPIVVDGRLFVPTDSSNLIIYDIRDPAAVQATVLKRHSLPGRSCGSPVYANGTLYVASDKLLYAIR